MKTTRILVLGLVMLCGVSTAALGAVYTQVNPYFSVNDSPFPTGGPGFYLEDFEDGVLNTLGVILTPLHSWGISAFSVDADDGLIDGSGSAGKSLMIITSGGTTGATFEFNAALLGQLPQNVGIVVTAANVNSLVVEAFDSMDNSLGTVSQTLFTSTPTSDDIFFGATHIGGISSLRLSSNAAAMHTHLDHLQYGPIPEPATLSLLAAGGLALLLRRRKT